MDIGLAHLDDVWGVGGGQRPVQYLIHQMILLLKEYLLSNDSNEAIITLRSLEVPHFHHEFVYEVLKNERFFEKISIFFYWYRFKIRQF